MIQEFFEINDSEIDARFKELCNAIENNINEFNRAIKDSNALQEKQIRKLSKESNNDLPRKNSTGNNE